jgi:hypothetical protein
MLYAPLTSPMRATCPAHLILLALITLTILGEEYNTCSSSYFTALRPIILNESIEKHNEIHFETKVSGIYLDLRNNVKGGFGKCYVKSIFVISKTQYC